MMDEGRGMLDGHWMDGMNWIGFEIVNFGRAFEE